MPATQRAADLELLAALRGASPVKLAELVATLPAESIEPLLGMLGPRPVASQPPTPVAHALEIEPDFVPRAHLVHISDRIAAAVADVERGESRKLIISAPPRSGKSHLGSVHTPTWIMRKHPDWPIMLVSHSPDLAASWGREVRRAVERHGAAMGLRIAPDAKAVKRWQTTQGGVLRSLSVGQKPTGEGAKVLILDDPTSGLLAAESEEARDALWAWWQTEMSLRLEPSSLVLAIGTRWHESDILGRLLSPEYEGDPDDWEAITLPAFASTDPDAEPDPIGRAPGEPLLSPLEARETIEGATLRYEKLRAGMSSYQWAALFEQRPAPAKGAVFSVDWWRFWSRDPRHVTDDGKCILLDPEVDLEGARCITSWDLTFKDTRASDYAVGQRWASKGSRRFLLDQWRARADFMATVKAMTAFTAGGSGPTVARQHLVEDKANGPAVMSTLRGKVAGLKAVNPRGSKVARARAVTPEIESGDVYLPDPRMPGFEWVRDLLAELRSFPTGGHDDMVDTLTQALDELREHGTAVMHAPGGATGASTGRRTRSGLSGVRMGRMTG